MSVMTWQEFSVTGKGWLSFKIAPAGAVHLPDYLE